MVKKKEEIVYMKGECSLRGFSKCLQDFLKLIKHFKINVIW